MSRYNPVGKNNESQVNIVIDTRKMIKPAQLLIPASVASKQKSLRTEVPVPDTSVTSNNAVNSDFQHYYKQFVLHSDSPGTRTKQDTQPMQMTMPKEKSFDIFDVDSEEFASGKSYTNSGHVYEQYSNKSVVDIPIFNDSNNFNCNEVKELSGESFYETSEKTTMQKKCTPFKINIKSVNVQNIAKSVVDLDKDDDGDNTNEADKFKSSPHIEQKKQDLLGKGKDQKYDERLHPQKLDDNRSNYKWYEKQNDKTHWSCNSSQKYEDKRTSGLYSSSSKREERFDKSHLTSTKEQVHDRKFHGENKLFFSNYDQKLHDKSWSSSFDRRERINLNDKLSFCTYEQNTNKQNYPSDTNKSDEIKNESFISNNTENITPVISTTYGHNPEKSESGKMEFMDCPDAPPAPSIRDMAFPVTSQLRENTTTALNFALDTTSQLSENLAASAYTEDLNNLQTIPVRSLSPMSTFTTESSYVSDPSHQIYTTVANQGYNQYMQSVPENQTSYGFYNPVDNSRNMMNVPPPPVISYNYTTPTFPVQNAPRWMPPPSLYDNNQYGYNYMETSNQDADSIKQQKMTKEDAIQKEKEQQNESFHNQRAEYYKKCTDLYEELTALKVEKEKILLNKKAPDYDEKCKANNSKQDEIRNKLKGVKNVVEMLTKIIGDGADSDKLSTKTSVTEKPTIVQKNKRSTIKSMKDTYSGTPSNEKLSTNETNLGSLNKDTYFDVQKQDQYLPPVIYNKETHPEFPRKDNTYSDTFRIDVSSDTYKNETHPESYKKNIYPDIFNKDVHCDTYKKETYPESSKRDAYSDGVKKDVCSDTHKKETYSEPFKKDKNQDMAKKDVCLDAYKKETYSEVSKKDVPSDTYKKETYPESSKRDVYSHTYKKESYSESSKKDVHSHIYKKESYPESSKKDIHSHMYKKESYSESSKKDIHSHVYKKESYPESSKKDVHSHIYKKESYPESSKRDVHANMYKKETYPESSKKVAHAHIYKKETYPESSKKDAHSDTYRKEIDHGPSKRDVYSDLCKKESHPELSKKDTPTTIYKKEYPDSSKKEVHCDTHKKEMDQESSKRDVYSQLYKKDTNPESSKKDLHFHTYKKEACPEALIQRALKDIHSENIHKKENYHESSKKDVHSHLYKNQTYHESSIKGTHTESLKNDVYSDKYKKETHYESAASDMYSDAFRPDVHQKEAYSNNIEISTFQDELKETHSSTSKARETCFKTLSNEAKHDNYVSENEMYIDSYSNMHKAAVYSKSFDKNMINSFDDSSSSKSNRFLPLEDEFDKSKIKYTYYDTELHWCQICDVFPRTISEYLDHLHSSTHMRKIKELNILEAPWCKQNRIQDEPITDITPPTIKVPINGVQFFIPSISWYCKLCNHWSGDMHCATAHLKSDLHRIEYNNYIQENPRWEKEWLRNRMLASKPKEVVEENSCRKSNSKKRDRSTSRSRSSSLSDRRSRPRYHEKKDLVREKKEAVEAKGKSFAKLKEQLEPPKLLCEKELEDRIETDIPEPVDTTEKTVIEEWMEKDFSNLKSKLKVKEDGKKKKQVIFLGNRNRQNSTESNLPVPKPGNNDTHHLQKMQVDNVTDKTKMKENEKITTSNQDDNTVTNAENQTSKELSKTSSLSKAKFPFIGKMPFRGLKKKPDATKQTKIIIKGLTNTTSEAITKLNCMSVKSEDVSEIQLPTLMQENSEAMIKENVVVEDMDIDPEDQNHASNGKPDITYCPDTSGVVVVDSESRKKDFQQTLSLLFPKDNEKNQEDYQASENKVEQYIETETVDEKTTDSANLSFDDTELQSEFEESNQLESAQTKILNWKAHNINMGNQWNVPTPYNMVHPSEYPNMPYPHYVPHPHYPPEGSHFSQMYPGQHQPIYPVRPPPEMQYPHHPGMFPIQREMRPRMGHPPQMYTPFHQNATVPSYPPPVHANPSSLPPSAGYLPRTSESDMPDEPPPPTDSSALETNEQQDNIDNPKKSVEDEGNTKGSGSNQEDTEQEKDDGTQKKKKKQPLSQRKRQRLKKRKEKLEEQEKQLQKMLDETYNKRSRSPGTTNDSQNMVLGYEDNDDLAILGIDADDLAAQEF